MPKFSIVIPAYNEADKIIPSLTQALSFMKNFCESFEIIVVDDGSDDNTAQLVKDYGKEHREIKLIENKHKGKGPSVWTGMIAAKGNYLYMADADFSTPIEELKKFYNWIEEHDYDIVIASREGVGSDRVAEPFYRHLMGRVFNLFVQTFALPGIKDSQCGFKLFKSKAAKDIFHRLHVYGEQAEETRVGYMGAFDVEVLYLAKKLGYKIKEVPTTWTYVKTSRLNPLRDSIKMTIDVFKIRLNDLRGLYKVK
jgi:glycosyltransferase involved in cell wall biosynthesis